jgi:hypothetical protein
MRLTKVAQPTEEDKQPFSSEQSIMIRDRDEVVMATIEVCIANGECIGSVVF